MPRIIDVEKVGSFKIIEKIVLMDDRLITLKVRQSNDGFTA